MTSLSLDLKGIRELRLPGTLGHLTELGLQWISLTNLDFIKQLPALTTLGLSSVSVRSLAFPSGGAHLERIDCGGCGTTRLIMAPDMVGPLIVAADTGSTLTLIVPESLDVNDSWDRQPIRVLTYPLAPALSLRKTGTTELELTLKAYPGVYSVEASDNLGSWVTSGLLTNVLGQTSTPIALPETNSSQFYRVALP